MSLQKHNKKYEERKRSRASQTMRTNTVDRQMCRLLITESCRSHGRRRLPDDKKKRKIYIITWGSRAEEQQGTGESPATPHCEEYSLNLSRVMAKKKKSPQLSAAEKGVKRKKTHLSASSTGRPFHRRSKRRGSDQTDRTLHPSRPLCGQTEP